MNLGRALALTTVAVFGLAAVTAVALVGITTALHGAVRHAGTATESVAAAERFRAALLLHARGGAPAALEEHETELRAALARVRIHAVTDAEAALIDDLEKRLQRYLVPARAGEAESAARELERVLRAARELVRLNLDQSQTVQAAAARWDRTANAFGIMTALGLVVAAVLTLAWLRSRVFRPVIRLREAIDRFRAGDRTARAPTDGPEEVRDIAMRLNELGDTLSEQQRRQLAFLSGVVHDLRNPLSALRLSLARVDPSRGDVPRETMAKVLSVVTRQVAQMDGLLLDLLDAAQVESGNVTLALEECEILEIARDVVHLYQGASSKHQLQLESSGGRIFANCDRARMGQVLNNLVSNAIKYSPDGGAVQVSISVVGREVDIAVKDLGIGIPPEEVSSVFEPFRRGRSAASCASGAGLGLYTTRRIVEAHGGRVLVESASGRGSTFRVRLPIVPAPGSTRAPTPTTAAAIN